MDFGQAIELTKQGNKIARKGWNGKNMWVSYTEGKILNLLTHDIWTENVKSVAVANGGEVEILGYLSMKTIDNKILIGWLATQTDILALDWFEVE